MTEQNRSSSIEIVNTEIPRGTAQVALFDFDGTLSLIRRGWQQVMLSYFVDVLESLGTGESRTSLSRLVSEFVAHLTGKQTIYQTIRLAEEVEKRGHTALEPLAYKHEYNSRLWEIIRSRVEGLEAGTEDPENWLLPGSRAILENLKNRGIRLYLASGTDYEFVLKEARLLQIDHYFDGGIFAALDQYKKFSKAMLIRQIFADYNLSGSQLVGFGDGYVEIENTKEVGGIAVGVASNEQTCLGTDEWKRSRLLKAGADIIIPEFRAQAELLNYLLIN
ncbi:MAG: HAD family hydrolase [Acidobacteriota bacterium]|nr:MAG: HAD family hydrolase [Acidobacteriota bacterium]